MARLFSFLFPPSRKGFELGINMIVVVILGVIIIGAGIVMIRDLSTDSVEVTEHLNAEQQARIKALMSEGKLVAVYPSNVQLRGKDPAIFALGVRNRLNGPKTFSVGVKIFDSTGAEVTRSKFTITRILTLTIPANADREALVGIQAKTGTGAPARGVYTVFFTVTEGTQTYDTVQVSTVTIG